MLIKQAETSNGLYLIDEAEELRHMDTLRRSKTMVKDRRLGYDEQDTRRKVARPSTQGRKKAKKERTSYVKLDLLKALDVFVSYLRISFTGVGWLLPYNSKIHINLTF